MAGYAKSENGAPSRQLKAMSPSPYNNNGWSQKYSTIVQTVTVVALFVGGIWAAVINPLSYKLTEIEKTTLSIREHEEFRRNIQGRLDALEANVKRIEADVVPRSTHELKWRDQDTRFDQQQMAIKDLRDTFGGSYSIKDAIATLQKQQDDIRNHLLQVHQQP